MKIRLLLFLVVCFAFLQPVRADDDWKNAGSGVVANVTAVNAGQNTITLTIADTKQTILYQVPPGTQLTIAGKPATIDQLKPGMKVLSYTEADSQTLSQLDVSKHAGGGSKKK